MKMDMETITYDDYYHYVPPDGQGRDFGSPPRLPTTDPFELLRRAHADREALRQTGFQDISPTEEYDDEMGCDEKGEGEEKKEEEGGAPVTSAAEAEGAAEAAGAPAAASDAPLQGVEAEEEEKENGTKTPVHDLMQDGVDGVKVHVVTEEIKRNVRGAIKDDVGENFGRQEAKMEAMFERSTAALMRHSTSQKQEMNEKVDNQKKEIIDIVNVQGKTMENKFDVLAARVATLEKDEKKKKKDAATTKKDDGGLRTPQRGPLRSMASGTPPQQPPRVGASPGPVFNQDAWANFRRSPPLPSEHLPGFPASASPHGSEFVPRSLIIKGWCKFHDPEKSLTREDARALGDRVLNLLTPESREMASLLELLLQNSRVVLKISGDGGPNCSRVQLELSQQLPRPTRSWFTALRFSARSSRALPSEQGTR